VTAAGRPAADPLGPAKGVVARLLVPAWRASTRAAGRNDDTSAGDTSAGDTSEVLAFLHRPDGRDASDDSSARPTSATPVLLLPGSRGDHAAPHLVALANLLAAHGHPVVRSALFEWEPGAGFVPPAERAVERMRAVLVAARAALATSVDPALDRCGWVIGGASYGGRVASLALATFGAEDLRVAGLVSLAYPLHPPGRPDRLRTAHWPQIEVPTLLISGDADPFLTLAALDAEQPKLKGELTRIIVPGAAHDLSVSSRRAPDGRRRSPADVIDEHRAAVLGWMRRLAH
jgi:predicted alpha/beta-hydrolase family hydrolase